MLKGLGLCGSLLFWLWIWPGAGASAQDATEGEPLDLDHSKWEELSAELDYTTEAPPRPEQVEKRPPLLGKAAYRIMRILLLVGAALLLALLLRAIILSNRQAKDKKLKGKLSLDELQQLEARLADADLESPLQRAIQEGQYQLAIRLYYLAVLQALAAGEYIRWKKEKTNSEYRNELAGTSFSQDFGQLTRLFERIWYGGSEVNRQTFETYQPRFRQILEAIRTSSKPLASS